MTSRRTLIQSGLAVGLTGLPALSQAASVPVEGRDYVRLSSPLGLPAKPLVIHDFFLYLCPHCLQFAPYLDRFVEELKQSRPDVQFVPVPVSWREDTMLFSQTYFAFEAMGKLEELHMPFWQWCIKGNHGNWSGPEDMRRDVYGWMNEHGIDDATFTKNIQSFGTRMKVQRANMIWQAYQVSGTPAIGIAGKYLTAPEMTGTRLRTIEAIRYLMDK